MEKIILNTSNDNLNVNYVVSYKTATADDAKKELDSVNGYIGAYTDAFDLNLGLLKGEDKSIFTMVSKKGDLVCNYNNERKGVLNTNNEIELEVEGNLTNKNAIHKELFLVDRELVFDIVTIYTDQPLEASKNTVLEVMLNDKLSLGQVSLRPVPLQSPKLYDGILYTHHFQLPVLSSNYIKNSKKAIVGLLKKDADLGGVLSDPQWLTVRVYDEVTADDNLELYTYSKIVDVTISVNEEATVGIDLSIPDDADYISIKPVVNDINYGTMSLYDYWTNSGETDNLDIPDIEYEITVTEKYIENGKGVDLTKSPYERFKTEVTRRLTIHTDISEKEVSFKPVLKYSTSCVYLFVDIKAKFVLDGKDYEIDGVGLDTRKLTPRKFGKKSLRLNFPGDARNVKVYNKRSNDTDVQNIVFERPEIILSSESTNNSSNAEPMVQQINMKGFISINRIVVEANNIVLNNNGD